jgi:hypothetical protein
LHQPKLTEAMITNYGQPLSNSLERMKKALFRPFGIVKWINIGFTAFLAQLPGCNGGGGGGGRNSGFKVDDFDWDKFYSFPTTAIDWLISHPLWFGLIILGIIFLAIIAIILTWLNSRGKFMFLYNVVNNRDDVVKPWNDYRKQGNSLFWWQFIYGLIVMAIFMLFIFYCFQTFKNIHEGLIPEITKLGFISGMVVIFLGLMLITAYISLFLTDFVVPVMFKHQLPAAKAWSKFLALAVQNMGSFFIYGLFIFALKIAVAIAVIFAALLTCCIGLFLIMIPFVGAVILLPVSYTFRAFSVEYFAMFGDDFNLLAESGETAM